MADAPGKAPEGLLECLAPEDLRAAILAGDALPAEGRVLRVVWCCHHCGHEATTAPGDHIDALALLMGRCAQCGSGQWRLAGRVIVRRFVLEEATR